MGDFSILANRIKELRKKENLTQREFAKKVGCTAATLSAYENGSKSPSLDIVKGIAEKCNVSLDWLCGIEKEDCTEPTYDELFRLIIVLNESVASAIMSYDIPVAGENIPDGTVFPTVGLFFADEIVNEFLEKWSKIKSLKDDKSIDLETYNTVVDGIIQKYKGKKIFPYDED